MVADDTEREGLEALEKRAGVKQVTAIQLWGTGTELALVGITGVKEAGSSMMERQLVGRRG